MKTIIITMFAILIISCTSDDWSGYDKIEYKITGTCDSVSVTLNNAQGDTEQHSSVTIPYTFTYDEYYDGFRYISAQNNNSYGSVTVKIFENGEEKKKRHKHWSLYNSDSEL